MNPTLVIVAAIFGAVVLVAVFDGTELTLLATHCVCAVSISALRTRTARAERRLGSNAERTLQFDQGHYPATVSFGKF